MPILTILEAESSGILGILLRVTKGLSPTKHDSIAESSVFCTSNGATGATVLTSRTHAFTPVNQPNAEGLKLCDYRR